MPETAYHEPQPVHTRVDGEYVTEDFPGGEGRPVGQGSADLNMPPQSATKGARLNPGKAAEQEALVRRGEAAERRFNSADKQHSNPELNQALLDFLPKTIQKDLGFTGDTKTRASEFAQLFWGTRRTSKKIVEEALRGDDEETTLIRADSTRKLTVHYMLQELEEARKTNDKSREATIRQLFIDTFNHISQRSGGDHKLAYTLVKAGVISKKEAAAFIHQTREATATAAATIMDREDEQGEQPALWEAMMTGNLGEQLANSI